MPFLLTSIYKIKDLLKSEYQKTGFWVNLYQSSSQTFSISDIQQLLTLFKIMWCNGIAIFLKSWMYFLKKSIASKNTLTLIIVVEYGCFKIASTLLKSGLIPLVST